MTKEKYSNNIPEELKERNQWLWFKIYHNEDKNGNLKATKIPVSPVSFESSGWNNKENWSSFETALNGLNESGMDGLSFVLAEDDPFVCVDLDNIKESNSEIDDIIGRLYGTYMETSVSGNGLHIFAKGNIPKNLNNQTEKIEMYTANKAIAMTADVVEGCTKIKDLGYELNRIYGKYKIKETIREQVHFCQNQAEDVPDIENILKAIYKHNRKGMELFNGSYSTGDASKDDFQLLLILNSFTHGDADLMLEIFLKSALNRMGDMSKRRTEASYIQYLNQSIRNAQKVGGFNYWDYNYHRK